jgi:hypothetical protein
MYRVPSEFIRQKNTIFGPITIAHVIGGFGGYLLSLGLGDDTWLTLACVASGLALTTVKVQGLVLYQFLPLLALYAYRKLRGDSLEPEEEPAPLPTTAALAIHDEDGRPIVFQEKA